MRNQRSLLLSVANCEIYAECLLLTGKYSQMVRSPRGQTVPPQLTLQETVRYHFKCQVWERRRVIASIIVQENASV